MFFVLLAKGIPLCHSCRSPNISIVEQYFWEHWQQNSVVSANLLKPRLSFTLTKRDLGVPFSSD